MPTEARYDGFADWYDETFADYPGVISCGSSARETDGASTSHVERGSTWRPSRRPDGGNLGVDISADQLRLARTRAPTLVRADARTLPFGDDTLAAVTASFLHTDVDEPEVVFQEVHRVLRPRGRFVYIGVHPCFVGPFVELLDDRTKVIHPGYRERRRWEPSRYFREEGCGRRVGYAHVPLAELIGGILAAGLRLTAIEEPPDDRLPGSLTPGMLALVAEKS